MPLVSRQRLGMLVRLVVCAAALTWIVHKTQWAQLAEVWRGANKSLLLLSLLSFGPAPVLIAIRLKWLLEVHEVRLSVWRAIKVTFAGNFIINALPVGTPGGDSVKAYYIARDTPNKHEAVTVVFFDRIIGVVGLLLMSSVVILVDWHNPAFRSWGRLIGMLVLAMAAGGAVYFSPWMRKLLRLDAILARLPLGSHLQRIDRAVYEFRSCPGRLVAALLITNLLQFICIVTFFLGGWALGMVGPHPWRSFAVYLAYTPICLLTGALPLGVMETTFQQLFSSVAKLGSPEAAVLLSIFGRFIQLAWALPGGITVLKSRPSADAPAAPAAVER